MDELPVEFIKPLLTSFDTLGRCNVYMWNDYSVWKKIRSIYMIVFSLIFYISLGLYIVKMFSSNVPVSEVAFTISIFLILVQATFKGVFIVLKRKKIVELIEKLSATWRQNNLNERQTRKSQFIFKRLNYCVSMYSWSSKLTTWNILLVPAEIVLWKMLSRQEVKLLLPFTFVLPFDPTENWMWYIIVYVFQVYTSFLFAYMYTGSEFLMLTLCGILSAEFAVLKDDFENIQPDLVQTNGLTIHDLIRKHQKLLLYNELLNDIYNKTLFFNLVTITIILSLFGFVATGARSTLDNVTNFINLSALLFSVFLFSFYSEQLKGESADIAEAAYKSQWHKGIASYQRIICVVILRAQKPCCLTSLGYAPINLNTFSKVISTTWSYYSLMRSVYSDV